MKKLIIFLFIFLSKNSFSQTVSVDNTTQSPSSIVNTLLGNSCIEVSNISISSAESVGYFNDNGSSFPIGEGIIIRNGNAKFSEGIYTGDNMDSQINFNNDPALQAILSAQGISGNITDVAFLEFDFLPLSNNFSFNFLFASNEYGQYQCSSFDTFAFLLTDLTTNITTNLAIIPGTSTPVSVLNVRKNTFNPGCSSANSQFFSTYNVTNPAASTINMRGYTKVMNASSAVIPNNPYKIRIAIGDYFDFRFDSAVFLSAGSFITTIDLGEDKTICSGNSQTITTGLDDVIYNHVWTKDGLILSETSNILTITEPGTYAVTITTNNSSCIITDEIIFNDLTVNTPTDLYSCFSTINALHDYNLTTNNEVFLAIDDAIYDVFYYSSLADISNNTFISQTNAANYSGFGNETIYIKLFNTQSNEFCDAIYSFNLLINDEIVPVVPPNLNVCVQSNTTFANLNSHFLISNPINPLEFSVKFFESLEDAEATINTIANPTFYPIPNGILTKTIWVKIINVNFPDCFAIVSFDVIINPLPPVDVIASPLIVCSEFILPQPTNGNYFSSPNGSGTAYFVGDILDETGTYYIFNGPDANGCVSQSSFYLYVIDKFTVPLEHCGSFSIPSPIAGSFYTASGGPLGTGTIIPPGTVLTSSQSIFYYAEVESVICRDEEFQIIIHPLPLVDQLNSVVTCVSYTLPPLTNGNYAGGYSAGNVITQTRTFSIVNGPDEFNCSNSSTFTVTIIPNVVDKIVCEKYTLPTLAVGNYYLEPGGPTNPNNVLVPQLTEITTLGTSTFYVYANTTSTPNCTNNLSFQVTINPRPIVDELDDVVECGSYTLPPLTNGNYFLLSGGPTTPNQVSFNAGQIVDLSGIRLNPGTFYIYSPPNEYGCDNQSSFQVIINPLPTTPEVRDFSRCEPFSLPNPSAGNYYTEPNGPYGTGTLVLANTVYTETKTFYLYSQDPTTLCFVDKPFTVYFNTINLPEFDDVSECDTYTLPNLTHLPLNPNQYKINYFSQPGGNISDIINPTDYTFATVGTYQIYVYAVNGDRFFACVEEKSFTITISETPNLSSFQNIEACGTYTLPNLPASSFNINYYSEANAVGLIPPSNYTFNTPGTYTIYVYTDNPINANCNDEESFILKINPLLDLNINDEIICVDPITRDPIGTVTLQSGLNPNFFEVDWLLNNQLVFTGPSYTTNQSGIYTVETTKLTPELGTNCNYASTTVQILESSSAIATLYQSSDFDEIANVTVEVTNGLGTYEFALDNGSFQTGNVFYNVSSGEHTVTIRDTFGNCDAVVLETIILKYPHYFTPNGDGENETWNIFDMQNFPEAMISIFDRYGKLIKQFSPVTFGWDGTYNGFLLPATDYWFITTYKRNGQEKEFKSHFSLVR